MLEGLNPQQHRAVVDTEGPMLLIAGAGSGKTRVLTTRIAHLIVDKGVHPGNILAFTFTNKAAREMRERVERLVPGASDAWIGTFHATGVRILRREAERLGYPRQFSIYDAEDSRAVVKSVLKALNADPKQFSPREVLSAISRYKNASVDPSEAREQALSWREERIADFYQDYQRSLRDNQAMDFDDLIVKTVELLESFPEVQERYARRFQYVLVDEFQDTNPLQLILIKALSAHWRNVFAVGDDDQAIYSWRGATVENMLNFEDYFPGARVLRLERNYRSTGFILQAANEVIGHNRRRRGKKLWTEAEQGEPLELLWVDDEEGEALAVRERIEELVADGEFRRRDCVVLYRTNAQSRALEDGLRRGGLPYQIIGGTRFYERREVRDLLAYLKLVVNPADQVSLERVINVPRRGIGKTSLQRLLDAAAAAGLSTLEMCWQRPTEVERACGRAAARRILLFAGMIAELAALSEKENAARVLEKVMETSAYLDWLYKDDPSSAQEREENVHELLNAAEAFVAESDEGRLFDFLESVALLADVDRMEADGDMVTLMTMHNAKGLEFPVVFVAGCEENLLPHANSLHEDDKLEEERRLFYVALTRAQRRVFLSCASMRRRFGGAELALPSRFLAELPADVVVERGERRPAVVQPAWGGRGLWEEESPRRRPGRPASSPGARSAGPARGKRSGSPARGEESGAGHLYGVETFLRSKARKKAEGHGFDEHELNQEEARFHVGQRVRHATLGEGVIEAVEGFGELTRLTIRFGEAGRKRILARYARLEAVEGDSDLPF